MNLPSSLRLAQERIRDVARSLGLDFFETIFEILPADQLNEIAAYGGFPVRYAHWRHGMEYEHLSKGYRYGLSKIYELVVNNDPCYAYLMAGNSETDQKLVMAHVYGHADFFKNNAYFARTNRRMIDEMANHAVRVRNHMDRRGQEEVENFLDAALSIDNILDLSVLSIGEPSRGPKSYVDGEGDDDDAEPAPKIRSKDYMDPFINPKEAVERRRARLDAERKARRVPEAPDRDVMRFLIEHAPLRRWERELLEQTREEALYFAPQRATKIMNEGWASYWHRTIMAEHVLTDEEFVDYARTMAGTLSGGGPINPYKIGLEIWLDIERRWNEGRHGPEFEACDDAEAVRSWNTNEGLGREMMFRVRRAYGDSTFVDEFLTEELCREQKMFVYRTDPSTGERTVSSREFADVKAALLRRLANGGAPVVEVVDSDGGGRGELVLLHRFDGFELRKDYAFATLRNIRRMWRRPVLLHARLDEKDGVYRADESGERFSESSESAS
jgi:stage V sporulation protein R